MKLISGHNSASVVSPPPEELTQRGHQTLFVFFSLSAVPGFFLMLRFYMLAWMRKQAGGSALGSTSTGSTRQHMLQAPEKS